MDQEPDPITACYAKKRYSDFKLAVRVAERCRKMRGRRIHVYPCYRCGGYHLTKTRGPDVITGT